MAVSFSGFGVLVLGFPALGLECCDLIALKKNELLVHTRAENLIQKSKGIKTEQKSDTLILLYI